MFSALYVCLNVLHVLSYDVIHVTTRLPFTREHDTHSDLDLDSVTLIYELDMKIPMYLRTKMNSPGQSFQLVRTIHIERPSLSRDARRRT